MTKRKSAQPAEATTLAEAGAEIPAPILKEMRAALAHPMRVGSVVKETHAHRTSLGYVISHRLVTPLGADIIAALDAAKASP